MRTSLAITALALCSIVGFSTPPSLQASAMARFECEECEHMGAQQEQMFCGGACENDQQFCGGARNTAMERGGICGVSAYQRISHALTPVT